MFKKIYQISFHENRMIFQGPLDKMGEGIGNLADALGTVALQFSELVKLTVDGVGEAGSLLVYSTEWVKDKIEDPGEATELAEFKKIADERYFRSSYETWHTVKKKTNAIKDNKYNNTHILKAVNEHYKFSYLNLRAKETKEFYNDFYQTFLDVNTKLDEMKKTERTYRFELKDLYKEKDSIRAEINSGKYRKKDPIRIQYEMRLAQVNSRIEILENASSTVVEWPLIQYQYVEYPVNEDPKQYKKRLIVDNTKRKKIDLKMLVRFLSLELGNMEKDIKFYKLEQERRAYNRNNVIQDLERIIKDKSMREDTVVSAKKALEQINLQIGEINSSASSNKNIKSFTPKNDTKEDIPQLFYHSSNSSTNATPQRYRNNNSSTSLDDLLK